MEVLTGFSLWIPGLEMKAESEETEAELIRRQNLLQYQIFTQNHTTYCCTSPRGHA